MKIYRYRRYFQTFFIVLFFALLTVTVWPLGQVFLGAFLMADPLIAINSVSNGIWKWEMLIAVGLLLLPLLLGRIFCGYICPLGFIVELLGPKKQRLKKTKARDLLLKLPVFILTASLGLLLFGNAVYLVFDPLALLTRTSTTVLYPFLDKTTRLTGDVLYLVKPLRPIVDTLTTFLSNRIIFQRPLSYHLSITILFMFLLLMGVSFWQRRLWCRHLCPLGALLGFMSRFSLFGRVVDESKCTKCLKCESACPLDAIREDGLSTDKSRCQLSFECTDVCPKSAIRLGIRPKKQIYNPSRRAFIATAGITALGGFFLSTSVLKEEPAVTLIRPPGAQRENDFMALCSRCGQCMKVCPTNVIQPSVFAAGLEGIFTPQMSFDRAYCDWSCNECSKVCPTGAIELLSLAAKRKTIIGRAFIDRNRCIPWTDFKSCLVCEELCPIPNKAILFREEKVKNPKGKMVKLKRPFVIGDRCIGCGICEFNCPVPHESAIVVRSTAAISPSKLRV